jgi:ureidoglycolate dehydrogenase (NAD+)
MAHKAKQQIPAGWAVDKDGHPTVDAGEALQGAVLPLAGYKGAGLALMIDALCGVLTGAAFGPHVTDLYDEGEGSQNVGHFFAAFSIDGFMPVAVFKERLAQFVAEARAQPRLPGVERIYLPGEIEFDARNRAVQSGIAIAAPGWSELAVLADYLAIASLADRLGIATVITPGD